MTIQREKAPEKPFVVGVAGGIGVGKSTVLEVFSSEELKIPVIKADDLAREAVEPGTAAYEEIADSWPMAIGDEGKIDRSWLRQNVLIDPDERAELEFITHAEIDNLKEARFQKVVKEGGALAVYEALFFELDKENTVDKLLLVDAPEDKQIEQATTRDGDDSRVAEIMALQLSREERLKRARAVGADIILNDGTKEDLRIVSYLWGATYLEIAKRVKRRKSLEEVLSL